MTIHCDQLSSHVSRLSLDINSLLCPINCEWISQTTNLNSFFYGINLKHSTTIATAGGVSTVGVADDVSPAVISRATTSVDCNAPRIITVTHPAASSKCAANAGKTSSGREQSHHRSLYNLACIMGAYLFFIAPYTCCAIYITITGMQECVSFELNSYLMWSPYFICLANPLVVILVQKDFRMAVKSIFRRFVK